MSNWKSMLVFGLLANVSYAKSKGDIDESVNAAMDRFNKDVKGANDYQKVAKGVLVIPNVTKAAFIIGGQYGQDRVCYGQDTGLQANKLKRR